jgi:hypothetical protein
MPKKPGLLGYVGAAFNARPMGMFVAPNWIGVAAIGLLGLANPGFWVLGAGLELGYLLLLATNGRFQRLVDATHGSGARGDWDRRIAQTLSSLGDPERARYEALAARCRSILDIQRRAGGSVPSGLDTQAESLGRLTWMYLRLLAARHAILHVLEADDADSTDELEARRAALERQLRTERANPDLARSREGQIDILRQRIERRSEAEHKRQFIDAELTRIEEQVELIREQAALSTDPEVLSRRIDEIAATLGGTSQWIRDQQQVFGAMDDLLSEPPPVGGAPAPTTRTRARESE